ncbi:MAG: hypothetical protein EAZ57_02950 [Cytophagales bacterium]|nr:MAG: hypothetical protein EAZ67_03415 [Cytophagales bacterium]TAF61717.1 MAG: hypothetical protein EAZ57_02950 [Cytophagales bacterium]
MRWQNFSGRCHIIKAVFKALSKAKKKPKKKPEPPKKVEAAKGVGRIQAGSLKEFKSLVQNLSKYGSEINQAELQQLEKLAEKFGGKLRYDLNPVKGKVLKPHVQVEGLGTSVEGRKIWLGQGVK